MTDRRGKRTRTAALYVEFALETEPETVAAALAGAGARVWEIDEDVDLEHWPQGGISRPAAVFRVTADREKPLYELLSAAAELPCVFSVSLL